MKKRLISIFLALVLLTTSLAVYADAEIEIVEQPTDISASIGEVGTATVLAESGGEITYQWFFRPVNGTEWQPSGMPGASTETIRVEVLQRRLGQEYKCVLTDEAGESVETEIIRVVNADQSVVSIDAQPEDIVAKVGELGSATVEASVNTDMELSYQWYFKSVNGTAWQASGMEGNKTTTITVPVIKARLGQQYKCVITTIDGGRAETDVVEVKLPEPSAIRIDTQPEDIVAKIGENGSATVEASAGDASLSYQWYFKSVNGTDWKASGMDGSSTATITVPVTAARIGQQYKCVITSDEGVSAETEAVVVKQPEPGEICIDAQPEDIVAAIGNNGSATVEATADAELSYQWYFKSVNGTEWKLSGMTGSQTPTITVPVTAARIGQRYKCVITAEDGGKAETVEIVIREAEPAVNPIEQPGETEITFEEQEYEVYAAIGESWSVTVLASADAPLSYQWFFKSAKGTEWTQSGMPGNQTDTITVPVTAARIGQQYKCLVSAPDGSSVMSQVFTIREKPAVTLTVTGNPDSYVVMRGQPIQLSVSAKVEEEGDYVFEYQWYQDDEPVQGANSNELVFMNIEPENAGSYYCFVSVNGVSTVSRTGTVEVVDLPED